MRKHIISLTDQDFIKLRLLPYAGLKAVKIGYSSSPAKWPDIWIDLQHSIPVITVTDEWARQSVHERRSRLTHEILHAIGLQHDERIGYSTCPKRDRFSKKVYRKMIGLENG